MVGSLAAHRVGRVVVEVSVEPRSAGTSKYAALRGRQDIQHGSGIIDEDGRLRLRRRGALLPKTARQARLAIGLDDLKLQCVPRRHRIAGSTEMSDLLDWRCLFEHRVCVVACLLEYL